MHLSVRLSLGLNYLYLSSFQNRFYFLVPSGRTYSFQYYTIIGNLNPFVENAVVAYFEGSLIFYATLERVNRFSIKRANFHTDTRGRFVNLFVFRF